MDRIANQARVAAGLVRQLSVFWKTDRSLPQRIENLIKADKRFGSRDRRLYREVLYTAVRYWPWVGPLLDSNETEALRRLAWLCAATAATSQLRSGLASGLPEVPPTLEARAAVLGEKLELLFPTWLSAEAPEALASPEAELQRSRAPLWIRLQTDRPERVFQAFTDKGWTWMESDKVLGAVRVDTETDVTALPEFEDGLFEVQDIGSQAILASLAITPQGRWLDACAGAGGKSLQLAALLGATGRVDATDIRRDALEELRRRAARARLGDRVRTNPPGEGYDGVLVDAPCSGSGTWRRSPHLLWLTSEGDLRHYQERQKSLLQGNVARVKPGGLLVYATCSQARTENEAVAEAFLQTNAEFEPVAATAPYGLPSGPAGLRLRSSDLDGDGYFVATFRRRS